MLLRHGFRRTHALCSALCSLIVMSACGPDARDALAAAPPPPGEAGRVGVPLRVDLVSGQVTLLRSLTGGAARSGPSFAILGRNELDLNATNYSRSAVGAFLPKKVRVRFDLALANRLTGAALVAPSFPAASSELMLFPFQITQVEGIGR